MKRFYFKVHQTTWQINYWFAGLIIKLYVKESACLLLWSRRKLAKTVRTEIFKTKFTVRDQTKFSLSFKFKELFHKNVATCSRWTLKLPSFQTVSTPFHRLFIAPHPLPRAKQTNFIRMKSSFSQRFFQFEALVAATKLFLFKGASRFYFHGRISFTVEWQTQ